MSSESMKALPMAADPASLMPLQRAYQDRDAAIQRARQALPGQPLVGVVGNTVPLELIDACGATPLRVAPNAGATPWADRVIEEVSDPDVRRIVEAYASGALNDLALLVVPRSTESQHKLYLSLREMWRTGMVTRGPEIWLYDIPHTQRPSSHAYGVRRTEALRDRLGEITGRRADESDLACAIALRNAQRRALQRLQNLRLQGRVSGLAAQWATGAQQFMPLQAGLEALQTWLDSVADGPAPAASGPRLLVTGVPLDHALLHALVDDLGACIVAENDEWGSRAADTLIPEREDLAPLTAIFEHVWRDVPCVRRHPAEPRPDWLDRQLAPAGQPAVIDGVLFHLPPPDDIHGWQFPADRDRVAAAGLPWLSLRADVRLHPDTLRAQLQAWLSTQPLRRA
ncbi:2-hydroxyacyl-CoA dehydratase family protein [Ideonella sp. DXS22W]|uniref:2-hydroxyacyl-CoA dehydratase family protein n=1 Tax=Pseudaquabacterium inlustre TaxID=2984192 RepID=A0ABU9CLP2_9BURK